MISAHETANQADVTFAMLVAACRLCTRISLCNCAMDVRVKSFGKLGDVLLFGNDPSVGAPPGECHGPSPAGATCL